MSQLSDIRDALAATIRGAGWARDFNVYPYDTGGIRYPAVVVSLQNDDPIDIESFGGSARLHTIRMRLRVLIDVTDGSPETALRLLDELLSVGNLEASSLLDTLFDNRTLGGAVEDMVGLSVQSVGLTQAETGEALVGADIPLTIRARRA